MRRFFIDQPSAPPGTVCRISDPDAKHIKDVLRLLPEAEILLFNGSGRQFKARINRITSSTVEVTITENMTCQTESRVQITVAQAFLKQKKIDTLVRQLTELGIDRWLPVITERVISRPDPKRMAARRSRWETIAREAVKQCERGFIPDILPPVSFAEALESGRQHEIKILFTNGAERSLRMVAAGKPAPASVMIMLGPEGGFTPLEIKQAEARGFIPASMGPRILKADTASLAACAITQSVFGDMG